MWIEIGHESLSLRNACKNSKNLNDFKRSLFNSCIVALIYQIWIVRNVAIFEHKVMCIDHIVR